MPHARCAVTDILLAPQLGTGLVQSVANWYAHGLIHKDLSVSNVGLAPDGLSALIWDFYTMTSVKIASEGSYHLIGTPLYMAISVQKGAAHTLSSELESIFYILLGLSSEDGMMHWQRSPPEDADAKVAAMRDIDIFHKKVRVHFFNHCNPSVAKGQANLSKPSLMPMGTVGKAAAANVIDTGFLHIQSEDDIYVACCSA